MKMRSKIIILISIAMLSFSACNKDELLSITDLEVYIELVDTNNISRRIFNSGEDLMFQYFERNKGAEVIRYERQPIPCPTFNFKLYDEDDNYIGDPIPPRYGCATWGWEDLKIEPMELKTYEVNWFMDTANIILPVGNYYLKYENTIRISEINESKAYNFVIDFSVE